MYVVVPKEMWWRCCPLMLEICVLLEDYGSSHQIIAREKKNAYMICLVFLVFLLRTKESYLR